MAEPTEEVIKSKFIVRGRLHSPYFIYFKANRELSDEEILKVFDLDGFEPTEQKVSFPFNNQVVHVATSSVWSLLADDWSYSLGFSDGSEEKLQMLSRQFDIYKCWIGDTGYEYHFTLYVGGKIVRDYSFWGGWDRGGENHARVEKHIGEPLSGEFGMKDKEDEYDVIFDIARYQGINSKMNLTARSYSKPKKKPANKGFFSWFTNS